MSDFFVDTSYKKQYVVVAVIPEGVILRPVEDDTIRSYWKEFISGYIGEELPADMIPTLHLTNIPPEVLSVDAYVDYVLECPRVEVHYGKHIIDVSDRVSYNHPNYETPGLYAIDYMLSATGEMPTPIWRSWLSIEEAPLLRRVITPWNRENKVLADLNRLIIEPQVTEALYEAGVPIYNFQQANANVAVSQFASQMYKNARAFVKAGRIFISGPRLPVGTRATVNGIDCFLREGMINAPFSRQNTYAQGDVVSYCGADYYALGDIPTVDIPNPENPDGTVKGSLLPTSTMTTDGVPMQYWLQGIYYDVDDIGLEDGEYELTSLWAVLDVNGYLFRMDLTRAFPVRHYWGHYNRKYFYDYAAGDLVAVVKDNVITLYQRNDTSIDEKGLEETYRPGHYKNPHWREVYSESRGTEITDPIIKPYTNATNAIVSKTYTAREEAFRMYANMVGMPSAVVDMLGPKYSVLLWAILYRTRETFPGIQAAFNAIGLDLKNLHRAHPSVKYSRMDDIAITDVYEEIAVVKELAKSVEADRVWTGGMDRVPDLGYLETSIESSQAPWISYSEDNSVWKFDPYVYKWVKVYSFTHVGSDLDVGEWDYGVNNRYYRADLNLMDRLSKDGALDLDDGIQWIDHNYFIGISLALTKLLSYEVPIYIYLRLKVRLASIGKATVKGVSNGVLMQDAWGGSVGLKLYPGKIFNLATCTQEYHYPNVLFSYEKLGEDSDDSQWEQYMDYVQKDGYRYYSFKQSVYLRMVYPTGSVYKVDYMWTSRYTIGCLGSDISPGTGDYRVLPSGQGFEGFLDASDMGVSGNSMKSPDVYLCKGIVGCTLRIYSGSLGAEVSCLQWNYVFDAPDWTMDEITKFADWNNIDGVKFLVNWSGSAKSFKQSIAMVSSPDIQDLEFKWGDESEPTLYIGGGMPTTVNMYDSLGFLRGLLMIPFNKAMVLDESSAKYVLKIKFSAG